MSEFTNVSSGVVRSAKGFVVRTRFGGGVVYEDAVGGSYFIDSEWMGKEKGITLYKVSPSNKGNSRVNIDQIFDDVTRALEWQGYTVEIA